MTRSSRPTRLLPIHCAWCEDVVGYSDHEGSHGICDDCFGDLEGVPALDAEELDELPYGVIELDADGVVRTYNAAEQELSGRPAEEVVGRSFFRRVAPCTAVRRFEGRWREFLASSADTVRFDFQFHFPQRPVDVEITFVRSSASTFVVVRRRFADSLPVPREGKEEGAT